MTKSAAPTPSNTPGNPSAVEPGAQPAVDPLEERFLLGWNQYRGVIIGASALVVAAVIGRYVWQSMEARRHAEVTSQFGAAETATHLKSFLSANASHPLAGLAQLRLGDESFNDGKHADAIAAYDQAAAALGSGPLATRARIGSAVAKVVSGQTAAGETALRQISEDTSLSMTHRAEATYHLAAIAAGAGRGEDVNRLSDQLLQMDPGSAWAQRALVFRAKFMTPTIPAASLAPAPADTPAGSILNLPAAK